VGYIIFTGLVLVFGVLAFQAGRRMRRSTDPEVASAGGLVAGVAVGLTLLFVVVFTAIQSFHSIPAGKVGLVYQFGDIVDQRSAGPAIIWPWQKLREANVQTQRATFDELQSFSSETQDVTIKATINYRVDPEDIQRLYRDVGPEYFDKLVPARVNQLFKDETVKYAAVDIAPNRERIRQNVRGRLAEALSIYSIKIEDLLVDNIRFSPEFTNAIEDKQIATQEAQAAFNRIKKAENEAKALIEEAEGIKKSNAAKRQSLTPLLVQQAAIDKLNPNVQVIMVPSGSNFLFPQSLLKPQTGR
jgi:regulator of protease activity HflC (stomatin/prohibitin superfamily)